MAFLVGRSSGSGRRGRHRGHSREAVSFFSAAPAHDPLRPPGRSRSERRLHCWRRVTAARSSSPSAAARSINGRRPCPRGRRPARSAISSARTNGSYRVASSARISKARAWRASRRGSRSPRHTPCAGSACPGADRRRPSPQIVVDREYWMHSTAAPTRTARSRAVRKSAEAATTSKGRSLLPPPMAA